MTAVQVALDNPDTPWFIRGGPLNSDYEFEQMHFHWGEDDSVGSEHRVNGAQFSMEAHAVHKKTGLKTMKEAKECLEGIAVVAIFFQVKCKQKCAQIDCKSEKLERLVDYLPQVRRPYSKTEVPSDVLEWFMDRAKPSGYYTYPGSFPLDTSSEVVTWLRSSNRSFDLCQLVTFQVEPFRQLEEGGHLIKRNYASVKPFNNRPILLPVVPGDVVRLPNQKSQALWLNSQGRADLIDIINCFQSVAGEYVTREPWIHPEPSIAIGNHLAPEHCTCDHAMLTTSLLASLSHNTFAMVGCVAWEIANSGRKQKFEIYSMAWQNEINLDNVVLAAASYGGPIAVVRDRKRFIKVQTTGKPVISIYTASGRQMSSIVWTGGQIIHLGWSSTEDLLCVQNDGCVLVYDMFGTYLHTFSMGQVGYSPRVSYLITDDRLEAKDTNIIEAKIFASVNGTGVVVLTSSYRFFLVNNVKEPKVRQLAEVAGLTVPPSSWCVISEDRHTRVLMARGSDLYLLKHSEQHAFPVGLDLRENTKSVVEMAVSHNNRHVALFTDLGHLWIGSADMRKKYCEFDTKCPSRPRQLVWCGTEAVVGHWDTVLLVVNRQGEFINYSYDSPVHLLPEMDGVRVLSAFTHEMIQKVPLVVQQIFRINSTEPGSYLLEASKQFQVSVDLLISSAQKRSHRSDEYIRLVKDQLNVAVRQCIEAAGYEFDPSNQMMLIRAAQFGKSFVPDIDSEPYVKMCRTLRVLNAVRNLRIGVPLTITQYPLYPHIREFTTCASQHHGPSPSCQVTETVSLSPTYGSDCSLAFHTRLQHLSFQVLLDRLVVRRHFYLAIQIAKYLRMPDVEGSSRILAHWACYKSVLSTPRISSVQVKQTQLDREQVARDIADKLGYAPGVSYSEIAKKAADCGRTQLAIKLIDYEPRASLQVPLLLKLGEDIPSLVKAIDSGDTDLVYIVLLHLRDNMPMAEFQVPARLK
uniref:Vacuolar protein sorting-associated protein 16 homolog n=1 Tax=Timema poppense TaxID=170557 RepID=A0A7R9H3L6_TIMPO|nr:unnamed protein product [Timema poppensis]